jgi:hypothetical protein
MRALLGAVAATGRLLRHRLTLLQRLRIDNGDVLKRLTVPDASSGFNLDAIAANALRGTTKRATKHDAGDKTVDIADFTAGQVWTALRPPGGEV